MFELPHFSHHRLPHSPFQSHLLLFQGHLHHGSGFRVYGFCICCSFKDDTWITQLDKTTTACCQIPLIPVWYRILRSFSLLPSPPYQRKTLNPYSPHCINPMERSPGRRGLGVCDGESRCVGGLLIFPSCLFVSQLHSPVAAGGTPAAVPKPAAAELKRQTWT